MAFLMLLHEKMRLQRKQNKLTLKQLRNGNMLSRMESKIKKREKYYSKLEKQLETQANAYKNSAKLQLSNMMGFGANQNWNMGNFGASSQAAIQIAMGWGDNLTKNPLTNAALPAGVTQELLQKYMNGYIQKAYADDEKTGVKSGQCYDFYGDGDGKPKSVDQKVFMALQQLSQAANSQVTQMQSYCQNMQSQVENNVSIWLDYQKEQLEAQQEWEMDLLAEEQADYEAEKESIAAELELVKQRKEAIEQELGQSIKDAAPKFGLA